MITNVTVPALLCRCCKCDYEWISLATVRIPTHCQNRECRSREWDGKKTRKPQDQKPIIVLPPVVKIRGGDDDEF